MFYMCCRHSIPRNWIPKLKPPTATHLKKKTCNGLQTSAQFKILHTVITYSITINAIFVRCDVSSHTLNDFV